MIDDRKFEAIDLRKKGLSIKSIAKRLNAAQSSVSIWVQGVNLTQEQIARLKANTHSPEVIENRRNSRLVNEKVKRDYAINSAKFDVGNLSKRELWLIGISLYWGEGGKTQSTVRVANGDPRLIQVMLRFFREICEINENKIKAHIHIYETLNVSAAEEYWQKVTGIPKERFYKTYNKPNISSKGKRVSLPYGVCDIYVPNSKLFLKIMGWIAGIHESTTEMI